MNELQRLLAAAKAAIAELESLNAPPSVRLNLAYAAKDLEGCAIMTAEDADRYMAALAKCRDAMPVPKEGDALELDWSRAMSDPMAVPDYVVASVWKMNEEKISQNVDNCQLGN